MSTSAEIVNMNLSVGIVICDFNKFSHLSLVRSGIVEIRGWGDIPTSLQYFTLKIYYEIHNLFFPPPSDYMNTSSYCHWCRMFFHGL